MSHDVPLYYRKCLESSGRPTRVGSAARLFVMTVLVLSLLLAGRTAAQPPCPEEPPLQNFTGSGEVACPCFVSGEQAGAVLLAPAEHYPIEILRVGIGWGSAFGGTPQSLESAIHIYEGGLPDPGTPISSLLGPLLTDGFINEFDFEPLPGEVVVDSGPFSVTLEFFNSNAGDPFAASIVHDGNGCQPGKNLVFAIPGGWFDACALGVTGDWVVVAIYRQVDCPPTGIAEEHVVSSVPLSLVSMQPNPFHASTQIEFYLAHAEQVEVSVFDARGRKVADLADRVFSAGLHAIDWSGIGTARQKVPSGVYFVNLSAGATSTTRKLVISR